MKGSRGLIILILPPEKRVATASLRQVRRFVREKTSVTIYNSLIKPLFDYCDFAWGNVSSSIATRLQKLQNRATRAITGKGYENRSSEMRKQLN